MLRLICAMAVSLAGTGVAAAQGAIGVYGKLAEALGETPADTRLDEDAMRELARAALFDGGLDASEIAVFEAFRDAGGVTAQVDGAAIPLTSDEQAQSLARLLRGPVDLNALWGDPAGLAALGEIGSWTGASEQRVVQFMAGKMKPAVDASRLDNGYQPFRDIINTKWNELQKLPVEDVPAARRVLYMSARLVAQTHGAPIVTYSWLRPEDFSDRW